MRNYGKCDKKKTNNFLINAEFLRLLEVRRSRRTISNETLLGRISTTKDSVSFHNSWSSWYWNDLPNTTSRNNVPAVSLIQRASREAVLSSEDALKYHKVQLFSLTPDLQRLKKFGKYADLLYWWKLDEKIDTTLMPVWCMRSWLA